MKGKSSAVAPVPLEVVRPGSESDHLQLAVVGPTSPFHLPLDWLIEEKPRQNSLSCPGKIDRYYHEPHTGRKFRSLPEVERYLMNGTMDTRAHRRSKQQVNKPKIQNTTLAIVTPPDFVLPDGWKIEGHQRHNCAAIDKYYIEPKTGRKFRSMISVKKHLQELEAGEISSGNPKLEDSLVIEKHKVPRSTTCSPDFVLPEGWITKKKHRHGRGFSSTLEKYYIEPETGEQFRSLVSVERYLKEKEEHEFSMPLKEFKRPSKRRASLESKSTIENQETSPESSPQKFSNSHPTKSEENRTTPEEVMLDNDSGPSEHSDTPKKSDTGGEEMEIAVDDFGCPLSTVNWVLAGPVGDMWNPYLGELMVPESTKQKWSKTFISSLRDVK